MHSRGLKGAMSRQGAREGWDPEWPTAEGWDPEWPTLSSAWGRATTSGEKPAQASSPSEDAGGPRQLEGTGWMLPRVQSLGELMETVADLNLSVAEVMHKRYPQPRELGAGDATGSSAEAVENWLWMPEAKLHGILSTLLRLKSAYANLAARETRSAEIASRSTAAMQVKPRANHQLIRKQFSIPDNATAASTTLTGSAEPGGSRSSARGAGGGRWTPYRPCTRPRARNFGRVQPPCALELLIPVLFTQLNPLEIL